PDVVSPDETCPGWITAETGFSAPSSTSPSPVSAAAWYCYASALIRINNPTNRHDISNAVIAVRKYNFGVGRSETIAGAGDTFLRDGRLADAGFSHRETTACRCCQSLNDSPAPART